MTSLRTKITLMMVILIIIVLSISTFLTEMFIRRTEHRKSDQLILLLCETGERNLDYYFNSVQKSVRNIASFVEADIDGLEDDKLARHMETARSYFDIQASKTNGVLTYYYRVDPEVSKKVKGFWYTDLDGEGFTEHEVTDITLYDTTDTSALVWFTVPKYKGESVWLPPYITDNLDKRVISYNVPIYYRGTFVGVVGIEVDYTTMAEQVDSIKLYSNGYAFLSDAEGNLFYHPRIDVTQLTKDTMPAVPEGLVSENTFVSYSFEGQEKEAAWLSLSNGMRLNVTVPLSEAEGDWQKLVYNIMIVALEVLVVASVFVMFFTRRITKPIEELIEAADQVDKGNYDITLTYDKGDEVGRLTRTFKQLTAHMKENISDLNKKVYIDALTSVRNKGAYSDYIAELQRRMEETSGNIMFAVGVFDCDDLKKINDMYGHEKGDIYLKTASRLICRVFQHSPVFRIGGDEFSVILQNEDFYNREALVKVFNKGMVEACAAAKNPWEEIHVTLGLVTYDSADDGTVIDVVRRADKTMYDNKRARKAGRETEA